MKPRLESVTVADLRSVQGSITVPLNAPVVLIHGPNGSGKTSILSAIEIALTGHASALRRADANYISHLTHRGCKSARILLSVDGLEETVDQIDISESKFVGRALLSDDRATFFSERCYLAQSTLGRLLEIYQYTDPRTTDSPLTRFVKDLLGLDQLDALIDGLRAVGDVRRLRNLVPEFRSTETEFSELSDRISSERKELIGLRAEADKLRQALVDQVRQLFPAREPSSILVSLEDMRAQFSVNPEERELTTLAKSRRELTVLRSEWELVSIGVDSAERLTTEEMELTANAAVTEWRRTSGHALERLIEGLRGKFSDLPSATGTDPEFARVSALDAVSRELARCSRQLERNDADSATIARLKQEAERSQARKLIRASK
jgi:exonuclease SbcC